MIPRLLLFVFLVFCTASGLARAETIRIGVLSSGPTLDAESDWAPFVQAMDAALGGQDTIRLVRLPPDALRAAVLRSEVEVVITNPVHFIEIRAGFPLSGAVATMDMSRSDPATPYFGGVIVRRRDQARWGELQALSGARVAYQDRGLLGGFASPLKRIVDAGVPRESLRFMRVGGGYDGVLEAVRDGRADIGFVRTGVMERWGREGRPGWRELEVVAAIERPDFPHVVSTPLYPEWPVVVMPHVEEWRARRFTKALLALESGSEALAAANVEQVTIPADYAAVEDLLRVLRLPPYDEAVAVTWTDVWAAHRLEALTAFAALLGIIGLTLLLARSRRQHRRLALALAEEQELVEQQRQRLEGILGAVRAGTWEWNVQTDELRINAHWAEMVGYRLSELAPISLETWRRFVHPEDMDAAWEAVQAHLRGETERYEIDLRMRHRDGRWVWMHDRGEVVARDHEGRPVWMCGLHLDITERRGAEDAVHPAR